jgi:nitrite reductase (NO-forming)
MHRTSFLLAVLAGVLGLAAVGFAVAQDQATPPADDAALCATPLAEAQGTPATVVAAATTAATPGGVAPGTPVGLFPCATPIDATPTSETGGTAGATAAEAVRVEFVDLAFEPAELSVPAGADVPFTFVNGGALPHNFTIDEPAVSSGDLASGASSEAVVNLPAGAYEYYCSIPGHREAGMVGTLTAQ